MIVRLLLAGARHRLGHLAVVAAAAASAAGVLAATAGLGGRLAAATGHGLGELGANLVVRPQVGGLVAIPAEELARVRATPGVEVAAGVMELAPTPPAAQLPDVVADAAAATLVLVSSRDLLALYPGWEVAGRWPDAGEVLVGRDATAPSGLARAGTLTTGEALDRALLLDVATLERAGAPVAFQRLEARVAPARIEEVAAALGQRIPGVEVLPLRRVTRSQQALARRLQLLLGSVGAVTLLLAIATVAAASLAQIDARRPELALLLSLGYSPRWVQGWLTLELLLAGGAATLLGVVAGELAAGYLAARLLGAGGAAGPWGALAAVTTAAAVLATAAAVTSRRVAALEPAQVLQEGGA